MISLPANAAVVQASQQRMGRIPYLTGRRSVIFSALLAAGLVGVLSPIRSAGLGISEGRPSPETVRSPKDDTFQSQVLTQRQRDEAAAAVEPALVFDAGAGPRQLGRLNDFQTAITTIRNSRSLDATQKSAALTSISGLQLSPRAAVLALAFTDEEWQIVQGAARTFLGETLNATIAPDGTSEAREGLNEAVAAQLGEGVGLLVRELAGALIAPTQLIDEPATRRARDQARSAVPLVSVTIQRGEVLVRDGEIADAAAIEKLRRLDLLRDDVSAGDLVAVALVSLASAAALGAYLRLSQPAAVGSARRLTLLALIVAATIGVARLALPGFLPDNERLYLSYLVPLAAAPMLVAALLDLSLAVVVAAIVAMLSGFAAYYQPEAAQVAASRPLDAVSLVATLLLAGLAGAFVAHEVDRMNRMFAAGAAVTAATVGSLLAFWLLDPAGEIEDLARIVAVGMGAGLGATAITLGGVAGLGPLFGVTTRVRLTELAQLDQPLLRRLREKAPGTFHHSVILSGLAERAADVVGAYSLLVRVGCYYHDIGKTLQPQFYIENQGTGPNPHDQLDPARSAEIIIEHVRGGAELARRHRLPLPVREFITEHHGMRPVSYFYRNALRRDPKVDLGRFRYPGPKPQSRETAIVMLADSVEAVVRSSGDRSPERIDALVDGVIAERLGEGELDECDLTLRDIATIAASFKVTLRGVYHPRIEYPAPTTEEQERAAEAARLLGALPIPMDGVSVPHA